MYFDGLVQKTIIVGGFTDKIQRGYSTSSMNGCSVTNIFTGMVAYDEKTLSPCKVHVLYSSSSSYLGIFHIVRSPRGNGVMHHMT